MTVGELRDRLILDGIEEVTREFAEGNPHREGALVGFELCRTLNSREEFETVLRARERRERRRLIASPSGEDIHGYRVSRSATAQVEWVLNCLIAAAWHHPGEAVSSRAFRKVSMVMQEIGR